MEAACPLTLEARVRETSANTAEVGIYVNVILLVGPT